MLQRNPMVKQAKDIRTLLSQRLQSWIEGKYDFLINEALSCNKKVTTKSNKNNNEENFTKIFHRLMVRGKVRDAMNWLKENGKNHLLETNVIIDNNGKTVFEVLNEKHPEQVIPDDRLFTIPQEVNEQPHLQQIIITNEVVEKISHKLHGGGGPGRSSSDQWQDFLLRYGKASHHLRDAVASLANKLCNHNVEWNQIHALMSCRLIALNKCPGVRPIGIGETLRRILSKCVLEVSKEDVAEASLANQLCCGLKGGIEGAIHAMNNLFQSNCTPDSNWGMLLVDAKNAFNMINRQHALWQARYRWPRAARYLYNTYRGKSELIVQDAKNEIYSKEGVIQGDPLSMPLYAIATLPLIESLQMSHKEVTQIWYADDSSAQGRLEELRNWWNQLNIDGPMYGYHPEGTKSYLIVSEKDKGFAERVFNDTGVRVVTGNRFLGSFIGSTSDKDNFVQSKINELVSTIEKLSAVGKQEPQSAYTAYVKSLQFQWNFFQRVLDDTSDSFQRLKEKINTTLLPAIFGTEITDEEAILFSLPVKKGGLAIMDPTEMSKLNFETSKESCSVIVSSILNKTPLNINEHSNKITETIKFTRNVKNRNEDNKLKEILDKFSPQRKRAIERAIYNVTKNSSSTWLTVLPLQRDCFDLTPNEFRDALAIRYHKEPRNMPRTCDGCGEDNFNLRHALCCKTGGLVTRRHNEVRDLLGELCSKSWGNVVKEPVIREEDPCLRGDLAVRGVWEAQRETLFDIRVVDTDAPSYASRTVSSVLKSAEEEKKKKYVAACEERHFTFTPLVVSVDGVLAPQMKTFMVTLEERLTSKVLMDKSKLKNLIRCKLSFSILRAASMCVRGTRRKFYSREALSGLD